jgi:hypothetical protein
MRSAARPGLFVRMNSALLTPPACDKLRKRLDGFIGSATTKNASRDLVWHHKICPWGSRIHAENDTLSQLPIHMRVLVCFSRERDGEGCSALLLTLFLCLNSSASRTPRLRAALPLALGSSPAKEHMEWKRMEARTTEAIEWRAVVDGGTQGENERAREPRSFWFTSYHHCDG